MGLEGVLQRLQELFVKQELFLPHAKRIKDYHERFLEPNRLLIMGEFSSGKSTLINTLLRQNVTQTGAVPTTAVATYIRYAEEEYIEIVYQNGEIERANLSKLHTTTSERNQQGKQLRTNIERINLYLCNEFLRNIVLIDTPGLNSSNATHNEQAFSAYEEADDGLWIFKYGAVGRATEFEMLKMLRDNGLHPLGVVNMVDEADEDDLTDYLSFELKKLEGRVRDIVGVSAKEAQDAIQEGDSELYELSGFPQLLTNIERIKQDKTRKIQRFQDSFLNYWTNLIEDIEVLLQSTPYINSVKNLQRFCNDVEQENNKLNINWISREDALQQQQNALFEAINNRYSMKSWITTDAHQTLQTEHEYLQEWEITLKIYEKVKKDNQSFTKEVEKFEQYIETQIGVGKNFTVPGVQYKIARLKRRELKKKNNILANEIYEINKKIHKMDQQLEELMPEIITYFVEQATTLKQQLDTINNEQLKQRDGNKQSALDVVKTVDSWDYLKDWRAQLSQVQQYLPKAKLTSQLSSNYLHEIEQDKAKNAILKLNDLMHDVKLQLKEVDGKSIDIDIPSQLEAPVKIPFYLLYSFKPALIAGLLACLLFFGMMYKDEATYKFEQMFATLLSDEDNLSDDSEDYSYLEESWTNEESASQQAYDQPFIEKSLGTINDNGYQTPVYNRASGDAEIIGYLNNNDYEVSHLTEEGWMKIGDGAWIDYHDNIDFNQHVLSTNISTNSEIFRTEQVTANFIPVFENNSRDSDIIGYLENYSELNIFELPNRQWANVGANAWIEADKYLNINWEFSPVSIGEPIGEIDVLASRLNVRQYDTKESNLIGQLEKGETVYVYSISQSTGWYSLGEFGWVSNDDEYVSYTNYEIEQVDSYNHAIGYVEIYFDINVYENDGVTITNVLPSESEVEVYEYSPATDMYRISETEWIFISPIDGQFYSY